MTNQPVVQTSVVYVGRPAFDDEGPSTAMAAAAMALTTTEVKEVLASKADDTEVAEAVASRVIGLNGVTGLWKGTQEELDLIRSTGMYDPSVVYFVEPTWLDIPQ
jgi:hypothetical protein